MRRTEEVRSFGYSHQRTSGGVCFPGLNWTVDTGLLPRARVDSGGISLLRLKVMVPRSSASQGICARSF
jgi:hypothetical protein